MLIKVEIKREINWWKINGFNRIIKIKFHHFYADDGVVTGVSLFWSIVLAKMCLLSLILEDTWVVIGTAYV